MIIESQADEEQKNEWAMKARENLLEVADSDDCHPYTAISATSFSRAFASSFIFLTVASISSSGTCKSLKRKKV